PVAGNPNGTITLVEFSDYQCPHCVDMAPVVENVIKKNPNLRVVLKEFPIRGPLSETIAKAALAAQKQGKYYEFHNALMSKKEPFSEDRIYDTAKSVGLDVNKLKADMKDNSVAQQIKNNYQLAQDLQLMFTPVFFIAKTNINSSAGPNAVVFIPGGVTEDQLNEAITKIGS
ncbi:MAG TPA: DsbA family protein, partial [Gammaproteobacteria bacterium]|nr:DsbA family protein [Gammaproteobacteria bacterium]